MRPKVKTSWLAALRKSSLSHHKGAWQMKSGASMSVLGVLCDLHIKSPKGGGKAASWKGNEWFRDGETEPEILPESVQAWAGLKNSDPRLKTKQGRFSISELNDGSNGAPLLPVRRIADLIEAQL